MTTEAKNAVSRALNKGGDPHGIFRSVAFQCLYEALTRIVCRTAEDLTGDLRDPDDEIYHEVRGVGENAIEDLAASERDIAKAFDGKVSILAKSLEGRMKKACDDAVALKPDREALAGEADKPTKERLRNQLSYLVQGYVLEIYDAGSDSEQMRDMAGKFASMLSDGITAAPLIGDLLCEGDSLLGGCIKYLKEQKASELGVLIENIVQAWCSHAQNGIGPKGDLQLASRERFLGRLACLSLKSDPPEGWENPNYKVGKAAT